MTPHNAARRLQVLLVDDEPADRILTAEAFQPHDHLAHLQVLTDPHDTLPWLRRQAQRGTPTDVVLLDLEMHPLSGFTLLNAIRRAPDLQRVRVVILATSSEPADITAAYAQGATSYLIKPAAFAEFEQQMQTLITYWHLTLCGTPMR